MTSFSTLVSPEERQFLHAAQVRANTYCPENHFKNWLERQDGNGLKEIIKGERESAQRFLYQQSQNLSTAFAPIPPHLISLTLAMIEKWGWDVDMTGYFPNSNKQEDPTEDDETFLEWMLSRLGEATSLPKPLQWPTTYESFVRFDQEHSPPRNQEWLAALLIASGANPWTMERKERRHLALQRCYLRHHPAIAVQLLSLPEAPSLREALDTPRVYKDYFCDDTPLLSSIFPDNPCTLERDCQETFLWGLFAFPDFSLTPQEMVLSPIETMAENLRNHPPGAAEEEVLRDLLDSHKENTTMDAMERLRRIAMLPKNRGTEDDILQKFSIEIFHTILESPWGTTLESHWEPQKGRGPQWLTQKKRVEGPFHGEWSLLNAYFMYSIQKFISNHLGTIGIPLNHWLSCEEKGASIPSSLREYPELANLLHEDLGNGLSVRGLWTLALLGQRGGEENVAVQSGSPEMKRFFEDGLSTKGLDEVAVQLGIPNLKRFFEEGREEAVSATEWILARSPDSTRARKSLASIWAQCLTRFPTWMDGHLGLLVRAIRAIAPGQRLTWKDPDYWNSNKNDAWETLSFNMGKILERVRDKHASEEEWADIINLSIEEELSTHHPKWIDSLSQFLETATALPTGTAERIQEWALTQGGTTEEQRSHPEYLLETSHFKRLKAALISSRLPQTTITDQQRKRF